MRIERVIKLEKSFAGYVHNIFHNAERFRWNHKFVNASIVKSIYENDEYRALPRYAQSFVNGVIHHCRFLHDKLMAYSYEIDGTRMMISEDRYRKIDPVRVSKEFSHTGAFVYKDDPSMLWTEPKAKCDA